MMVVSIRKISLGGWVKTLGDGVQTSARAKWNIGMSVGVSIGIGSVGVSIESISISRSLSIVRNMSLSYRVQSLSNRVQTCARTKWNISMISISIRVAVAMIEGISISTASCK